MTIKFGSFDGLCEQAALVVCPLIGSSQGVEPTCYSRNVQVGNTVIFQPGKCQHIDYTSGGMDSWNSEVYDDTCTNILLEFS